MASGISTLMRGTNQRAGRAVASPRTRAGGAAVALPGATLCWPAGAIRDSDGTTEFNPVVPARSITNVNETVFVAELWERAPRSRVAYRWRQNSRPDSAHCVWRCTGGHNGWQHSGVGVRLGAQRRRARFGAAQVHGVPLGLPRLQWRHCAVELLRVCTYEGKKREKHHRLPLQLVELDAQRGVRAVPVHA